MNAKLPCFKTEADLCRAFSTCIPEKWTAYNETGNFDILMVHENGVQIGIEAKLILNAKVLCQAIRGRSYDNGGPDFRAVLVGRVVAENDVLAAALGITVIALKAEPHRSVMSRMRSDWQGPELVKYSLAWRSLLPKFDCDQYKPESHVWLDRDNWFDQAPTSRLPLPEYVPDVEAGHPSPQTLSKWKIQAMKVCVHALKAGKMNRAQFKALKIDPGRWLTGHWMEKAPERGFWKPTDNFPADVYCRQHPEIYAQIEADYPAWSVKEGLAAKREASA